MDHSIIYKKINESLKKVYEVYNEDDKKCPDCDLSSWYDPIEDKCDYCGRNIPSWPRDNDD